MRQSIATGTHPRYKDQELTDDGANTSWRRVVLLCTALILGYSVFLAVGSLKGFPSSLHVSGIMPYLSTRPVGEDGFYMLTVAWNLAAGRGLAYNFGEPTTGIQPLATLIFGGLAFIVRLAGGDKWTFVRAVIVCGSVTLIAYSYLIMKIAAKLVSALPASERKVAGYAVALSFAMSALDFTLFRIFSYGLETGFYLLCLAATLLVSLQLAEGPKSRLRCVIAFGVLCGVTGLARLDFGVVLPVALVMLMRRRILSVAESALASVIALIIVSPWFGYVKWISGHWMPSSGGAQSHPPHALGEMIFRISKGLTAAFDNLNPWIYSGMRIPLGVIAAFTLAGVLYLTFRTGRAGRPLTTPMMRVWWIWLISYVPLVALYVLLFWDTHFYVRYFTPLALLACPPLALVLASATRHSKHMRMALMAAQLVCFSGFAVLLLHLGDVGSGEHAITAGFLRQPAFSRLVVGAFQSGTNGYFNENVVNLDGKLDYAALDCLERNRIDRYIDSRRIDLIVDWPKYINRIDPTYLRRNFVRLDVKPNNQCVVYKRIKPFDSLRRRHHSIATSYATPDTDEPGAGE